MEKSYYVYLLASAYNGTLYVGVTGNLQRRIWEHKNKIQPSFSSRYSVCRLVWYECHSRIESAIQREKQLKNWKRIWKIQLFQDANPDWKDLYEELL